MTRRLLKVNASHVQLAQERNRRYMTLSMRMFSTRTNLNGVAVTEEFINKIVENAQDYVSMPLCADVRKIERGDLRSLGHMYDEDTGLFEAAEIGSYVSFVKVIDEDGTVALNGTARVNRRNPKVVEAIKELYAEGNLNFSFEIEAGSFEELPDGTILIDAADDNDLMAMAVVSTPAYPEAKAISLVASKNEAEKEEKTEGEPMNKDAVQPDVIETEVISTLTVAAEENAEAVEAEAEEAEKKEDECGAEVAESAEAAEVAEVTESAEVEAEVTVEAEAEAESTVEAEVEAEVQAEADAEANTEVNAEVNAQVETEAAEAEVAETETAETEVAETEKAEAAEANDVTAESVVVEVEIPEPERVEVREDIDEMRRELEELRRFRDEQIAREREAEEERMRREYEARKALLFEYAEAVHLSIMDECVAAAIENLDYETLVLEVANRAHAEKAAVVISSRIDNDLTPKGNRNSMFDRLKG